MKLNPRNMEFNFSILWFNIVELKHRQNCKLVQGQQTLVKSAHFLYLDGQETSQLKMIQKEEKQLHNYHCNAV